MKDSGRLLSTVTWLHFGLWSVGCFLLTLPALLTLPWDRERRVFNLVARLWGAGLARTTPTLSYEMRGAERVAGGPYVVVMNHLSRIDPVFALSLPMRLRMVVKAELLRSPLGLNLRLAGYIGTGRGASSDGQQVLERGLDWLRRGVSVMLFPEGHRTRDGSVGRFKRGGFEMAVRAGVPVLPVVLAGSDDVTRGQTLRVLWGQHVIVSVLPPVETAGRTTDEVRGEVRAVIAQHGAELREELRSTRGQGGAWEASVSTTSTR